MLSCFVKVELTTKVATCFPSSLTDPEYLFGSRDELDDAKIVSISTYYINTIYIDENTFHQLHFTKSHQLGDHHSVMTVKHLYWNQRELINTIPINGFSSLSCDRFINGCFYS